MSACSMLSENTGHGVRTTHRTNPLIRPGSAAWVATEPPYRSAVTCRKLKTARASRPLATKDAERSRNCRETVADRYLSAGLTTVADDVRSVYAAGRSGGRGGRAARRRA